MYPFSIKEIPSLPGGFARSDGSVKLPDAYNRKTNFRKGTVTSSSKTAKHKYYGIFSRRFGNLKVHQLVCEAFHGPRPSKEYGVSHINEDPLDNRPENLKWATQKENLNMPNFIKYCKNRLGENSPVIKGRTK